MATDPDVVARGAELAGVKLLEEHHDLLQILGDAGAPDREEQLLQTEVGRSRAVHQDPIEFLGKVMADHIKNGGMANFYAQFGEMMTNSYDKMSDIGNDDFANAIDLTTGGLALGAGVGAGVATAIGSAATAALITGPIGMIVLAAAALVGTVLKMVLGGGPDLGDLYELIMKQSQRMINTRAATTLAVEFQSLREELEFVPRLFEGPGQEDPSGIGQELLAHTMKRVELMWFLMVYHDTANLRLQVFGVGDCPDPLQPGSEACKAWGAGCTVLQATELLMFQYAIIMQIATLEPSWRFQLAERHMGQQRVTENINYVGLGMWNCLRVKSDIWPKVPGDMDAVYYPVQQKMRFLLKLSRKSSHRRLLYPNTQPSLEDTVDCFDRNYASCPSDSFSGIMHGYYFYREMHSFEWAASYRFPGAAVVRAGGFAHTEYHWRAICPTGYFVQKLTRAAWHSIDGSRTSCQKPAYTPARYGECIEYHHEALNPLKPWIACPPAYFIAEIQIGNGEPEFLRCCEIQE